MHLPHASSLFKLRGLKHAQILFHHRSPSRRKQLRYFTRCPKKRGYEAMCALYGTAKLNKETRARISSWDLNCTVYEIQGIREQSRYSITVRTLSIDTFTNFYISQDVLILLLSLLTTRSISINISHLPFLNSIITPLGAMVLVNMEASIKMVLQMTKYQCRRRRTLYLSMPPTGQCRATISQALLAPLMIHRGDSQMDWKTGLFE